MNYNIIKEEIYQIARLLRVCLLKLFLLAISSLCLDPSPNNITLQISIGWLYVVTLVIPLALKGILPIHIIPIGKIL